MIGVISTFTTLEPQPVDSQVEERASTSYLINTDCIIEMVDQSDLPTVTTELRYKFNVHEDRQVPFKFDVNETLAAIQTLTDATPASPKIALSVLEDIQTFDLVSNATAVTWYFNVDGIVWGEDDPTGNYARIWVTEGGHDVKPYIVDHNISQIVDLADTGTTTTTTSSTSSTSTTTTSA